MVEIARQVFIHRRESVNYFGHTTQIVYFSIKNCATTHAHTSIALCAEKWFRILLRSVFFFVHQSRQRANKQQRFVVINKTDNAQLYEHLIPFLDYHLSRFIVRNYCWQGIIFANAIRQNVYKNRKHSRILRSDMTKERETLTN